MFRLSRSSGDVRRDVKWGITHGLGFAAFYSLFAVVLYVLRGARPFEGRATSLSAVIALYFAGGVIAGAIVGALRPLTRSRGGSMVVGIAAMIPVFLGVGILLFGPLTTWGEDNWVPMMLGALVLGPMLGSQQWKQAMEGSDEPSERTASGSDSKGS